MGKTSRRLKEAREAIDRLQLYSVEEALGKVKEHAKAKFDETVEMGMRLGLDPKRSEQGVRGTVVLPNGVGKEVRVGVFAKEEKEKEEKKQTKQQVK